MNKPLVTVAIITYNSSEFINETINSVINQTYDNWKIVVADDGSTDSTPEILRRFKEKLGNKITIILHENNQGANTNWNSLVPFFKGKYIAKLDGDDLWHHHKLESQVEFMETNQNIVISYHTVYKIIHSTQKIQEVKTPLIQGKGDEMFIKHGCFACSPTVMVRNICDLSVPKQLKKVGDWYMWILVGSKGDVGFIDKKLAYYRIHNDNVTIKDNKIDYILENILILDILKDKIKVDKRDIEDAKSRQLSRIVRTYIKLNKLEEAKGYLKKIPFDYKPSFQEKIVKYILVFNLGNIFKLIYPKETNQNKRSINKKK